MKLLIPPTNAKGYQCHQSCLITRNFNTTVDAHNTSTHNIHHLLLTTSYNYLRQVIINIVLKIMQANYFFGCIRIVVGAFGKERGYGFLLLQGVRHPCHKSRSWPLRTPRKGRVAPAILSQRGASRPWLNCRTRPGHEEVPLTPFYHAFLRGYAFFVSYAIETLYIRGKLKSPFYLDQCCKIYTRMASVR